MQTVRNRLHSGSFLHGNVIEDYDDQINVEVEAFKFLQLPMDRIVVLREQKSASWPTLPKSKVPKGNKELNIR